jgi:hypothetical protein
VLVNDIAIWNAPLPSVRYGGPGAAATRDDVTGQRAGHEFIEADYVPVKTYLKTIRSVVQAQAAPVKIVSMVHDSSAIAVGRAQAAIQLYSSIFNYRDPPAGGLSVRV